jgi:lipopolysaccharide transport system ATP-binding protein
MGAIGRLCRRAIWLDHGTIAMDGEMTSVVANYLGAIGDRGAELVWEEGFANPGVEELSFTRLRLLDDADQMTDQLDTRRSVTIELAYTVRVDLPDLRVGFVLSDAIGTVVFETYDVDSTPPPRSRGEYLARCVIPGNLFNVGTYWISPNAGIPGHKNLAWAENALAFTMHDTGGGEAGRPYPQRTGVIRPILDWQTTRG